ncbi:MAG TPA: family 16 glycoside hydrolase, partial [Gemmataceae bacterium]
LALTLVLPILSDDGKKDDDGFVPMFNGKDLTGWVNVNCAPETFFVKGDEIITTGKPTGYLRTDKQFENFIAEFDWKHIPPKPEEVGNSGFFVWADPIPAVGTGYTRGIEVQVLVNLEYKNKKGEITATSHGDLFSIWGATCVPDRPHPDGWERCLPSENRAKGANEWNHYRVEANDGVIKLAVNGKVVSGVSKCNPRKGYLALESEGSECRFRNLKIKELPSTNPKPKEIADEAQGHQNLFFGNLTGWKADEEGKKHWKANDWVLHYDGKGQELRTEKEFANAEFVVDFQFPKKEGNCAFALGDGNRELKVTATATGKISVVVPGSEILGESAALKPLGQWNRLRITPSGEVAINGKTELAIKGADLQGKIAFTLRPEGEMEFANLFVRPLK